MSRRRKKNSHRHERKRKLAPDQFAGLGTGEIPELVGVGGEPLTPQEAEAFAAFNAARQEATAMAWLDEARMKPATDAKVTTGGYAYSLKAARAWSAAGKAAEAVGGDEYMSLAAVAGLRAGAWEVRQEHFRQAHDERNDDPELLERFETAMAEAIAAQAAHDLRWDSSGRLELARGLDLALVGDQWEWVDPKYRDAAQRAHACHNDYVGTRRAFDASGTPANREGMLGAAEECVAADLLAANAALSAAYALGAVMDDDASPSEEHYSWRVTSEGLDAHLAAEYLALYDIHSHDAFLVGFETDSRSGAVDFDAWEKAVETRDRLVWQHTLPTNHRMIPCPVLSPEKQAKADARWG